MKSLGVRRWFARLEPVLPAAAILAVVAVIYGASVGLPLAFDDAWSVRLVEDYTLLDAFTRTANFGYYRPIYLLGYMLANAVGSAGPELLHVLCLVVHAANAILLTRFARVLLGARHTGFELAVGLLYALNPFVFQAVALPAGLNHLLALLFILCAALAYARARQLGRRHGGGVWWAVALTAGALACLSNEIGVVVAVFCCVYEVSRAWREGHWTRGSWSFLGMAAFSAVYLAFYQLIPKGQPPETVMTLADMAQRLLYAAQLWAYPIAALLKPFIASDEVAVVASAIFTALACLLALRGRWRLMIVCGALLFVGAALPLLARLPAGYLLNAPRAFYVPLTGVALLWAALLLSLADLAGSWSPRRWLRVGVGAVSIGLVCAIGVVHSTSQLALHASAHQPVAVVAEVGASMPPGGRMLVLNLPEWIAPKARHFPIGSEGVIVMAPYVGGDDLVLANTGQRRAVDLGQYRLPFDPGLSYVYQTWGREVDPSGMPAEFASVDRIVNVRYLTDTLSALWLGGAEPPVPGAAQAVFDQHIELSAYHLTPCREGWVLATRWRLAPGKTGAETPATTLSMFAQGLDAEGNRIAQNDGALAGGLMGFQSIPAGRDVVDRRLLSVGASPEQASGPVTLYLGVYDYQNGQRLPATGLDGARLEGDALAVPLPPRLAGALPCK